MVTIKMHTTDAYNVLTDPGLVREKIGAALDEWGLQEEIDYTLEVNRAY